MAKPGNQSRSKDEASCENVRDECADSDERSDECKRSDQERSGQNAGSLSTNVQ